jgi:hypothetical protein
MMVNTNAMIVEDTLYKHANNNTKVVRKGVCKKGTYPKTYRANMEIDNKIGQ